MEIRVVLVLTLFLALTLASSKTRSTKKAIVKYPKDTEFWVTDFFTHGCKNFLTNCPRSYKQQIVCARSHGGEYRDFANYCEMQYENCNTWNNWRIFKRAKC